MNQRDSKGWRKATRIAGRVAAVAGLHVAALIPAGCLPTAGPAAAGAAVGAPGYFNWCGIPGRVLLAFGL